jgi:neutral ceramidase
LSGVISADFPGEASRYIEELFDNRPIAVFSQGASGDQNPRDFRSPTTFMGQRAALSQGRGPFVQTLGAPTVAPSTSPQGFNAQQASAERRAIPAESLEAYKRSIARTGENVFPGYKDGPDVNLKVGLLRIGDVHFVSVNGEVYSQIGMRVKAQAPARKTIVVTLANGSADSVTSIRTRPTVTSRSR